MKTLAALALAWGLVLPTAARASLTVAGELVVNLRAADLDGGSTTWVNQDASGATVGDFSTVGRGTLNVAGVGGVAKSLHVNNDVTRTSF